MKCTAHLKRLNSIFRVTDWIHYLGFTVLGYLFNESFNVKELIFLLICSSLLLAYAYSFNDFFDKRKNFKKFIQPTAPLILYAFLLPLLTKWQIILSVSFCILFTLYSMPKVKLKSIPLIVTLTNAISFPLLFLYAINRIDSYSVAFFIQLIFISFIAQLIHELAHQKDDKRDKIESTATYLGEVDTVLLSKFGLLALAFISFTYLNNAIRFLLLGFPILILSAYFIEIKWKDYKKVRAKFKKSFLLISPLLLLGVF